MFFATHFGGNGSVWANFTKHCHYILSYTIPGRFSVSDIDKYATFASFSQCLIKFYLWIAFAGLMRVGNSTQCSRLSMAADSAAWQMVFEIWHIDFFGYLWTTHSSRFKLTRCATWQWQFRIVWGSAELGYFGPLSWQYTEDHLCQDWWEVSFALKILKSKPTVLPLVWP